MENAMGHKALERKARTPRRIRLTPLTPEEQARLATATYEGSPLHKRNPGDFGLTPPAAPRPDKTLCDSSGVVSLRHARRLFANAIARSLVSEATTQGYPARMWLVDESGQVFECKYGGSRTGAYHGYPLEETDPQVQLVLAAWERR
jgi:hypothetical protein